jgi:hypothetical protein
MDINGKILYEETQQFRIKWLWAIIILSVASSIGIVLGVALLEKEKSAENWIALAIIVPLESLIMYMMYITKLETVITTEGVYYRWWPVQRKGRFIAKSEVENAEIRTGPGLSYGIHWLPGYGRINNVGPGKGIQFVLQNGKKVFLGTQSPESLQTALKKIMTVSYKE